MKWYLCGRCGRLYRVEPTGNYQEWRVRLATGETVRRLLPEPASETQPGIDYALGKATEPRWYMAEFTPVQVQAAPEPLCHLAECAMAGALVETVPVLVESYF